MSSTQYIKWLLFCHINTIKQYKCVWQMEFLFWNKPLRRYLKFLSTLFSSLLSPYQQKSNRHKNIYLKKKNWFLKKSCTECPKSTFFLNFNSFGFQHPSLHTHTQKSFFHFDLSQFFFENMFSADSSFETNKVIKIN